MSLSPPLFLRIENTDFAPIIGACHNVLQPETLVTDWWQLSNRICFLANFAQGVHLETVVWSTLKWPRGHNWGWQDHEDKERKYWWTCKKCPTVQRTVSGKGGKYCRTCNVRRAHFATVCKNYMGGGMSAVLKAATSKQSREAWWGLAPPSPFGSCVEWAGFTASLKSKWVGESV